MHDDLDRYEIFYADKLWKLLPEVYRASDSDDLDAKGPLRELCERIGAQAAIVRRSIDRTWEDQSIESCDEWVVPYIADLLATNLVSGPDLAGQRREVAKTIYYRRRKGTLALLEELAHDVTGWDVRIVELFRRLARTPHGIDPEIGLPTAENERLQFAQGLVGRLTKTPKGGTASVRHAYGASRCGTAFDEFFHTPDMRRGEGNRGWYNIPKLGVFVWRLYSFPRVADQNDELLVTPVAGAAPCGKYYTFDPTGRDVPLFTNAVRLSDSDRFGSDWVESEEWHLPAPIAAAAIAEEHKTDFVPRSVGVFLDNSGNALPSFRILPEAGRFVATNPIELAKKGDQDAPELRVRYHYGFAGHIGAGAYDRRVFPDALRTSAPTVAAATMSYDDSRTQTILPHIADFHDVTILAKNGRRPLLRPPTPGTTWAFDGDADRLRFEGIFTSGVDLVLRGTFDEVAIAFSTFDPGLAAPRVAPPAPQPLWASAIDKRPLLPATLWIEGTVRKLTVDRSITGPIRTRGDGLVEELIVRDSIVQFPPVVRGETLGAEDFVSLTAFALALRNATDPLSVALRNALPSASRKLVKDMTANTFFSKTVAKNLINNINAALPSLPGGDAAANRAAMVDAHPQLFIDHALALSAGEVRLVRATILGAVRVHRIDVSESIVSGVAVAEDAQHGCVRFSAWTDGSVLPRKYESVRVEAGTELFQSRAFGQPAYAQLRGGVGTAILEGAENGSEMGAFSSEMASIKERRLRIKLEEYMPLGLTPVIVHAT